MSSPRTTLLPAFIVFLLLVVGLLTWSAFLAGKKHRSQIHNATGVVVCTQDVMACPDGSSVGRQSPTCTFARCPETAWSTYRDPGGRFSFEFPSTWTIYSTPQESGRDRILLSINTADATDGMHDGQGASVVVSLFADMNSDAARGGAWEGMRTYTSLVDFLSDRSALKRSNGQVIFGGQTGYEVSVSGESAYYGLMAERSEGIYEVDFLTRTSKNVLTAYDRHIIDSWRFGPLPSLTR